MLGFQAIFYQQFQNGTARAKFGAELMSLSDITNSGNIQPTWSHQPIPAR
jgi:hypothetical protein